MSNRLVPVRRALLSVSDKTDLVPFARALADRGVEIVSTGGTHRALVEAGVNIIEVPLRGQAEALVLKSIAALVAAVGDRALVAGEHEHVYVIANDR